MSGYRVCVIGGGPAGIAAALEGARLGLDVDLFERNHIGERIRCAEGFYDSLQLLGEPAAGVRFKVDEVILKVNREFRVGCRKINLWMIDRAEWQCYLAEQAKAAGAKIFEKTRITVDDLSKLQESYDWVIDASGVPSLTSLKYGFCNYYKSNSAVAVQYLLKGNFSRQGERLKFVLLPYQEGYFWVFPKDSETANVGFGLFRPQDKSSLQGKNLWQKLDQIMAQENVTGEILKKSGGIIPLRMREQLRYGNLLLVGDAAGSVSPLHGEGIDLAVITGRMAAAWIARGDVSDDFSQRVWCLFKPKMEVEKRICSIWQGSDRETLDHLAGLVARDFSQLGIWGSLRCLWLFIKNAYTFLRFQSGLTTGKW
jgi:digeranylgeranylglycerophospholipid reductase